MVQLTVKAYMVQLTMEANMVQLTVMVASYLWVVVPACRGGNRCTYCHDCRGGVGAAGCTSGHVTLPLASGPHPRTQEADKHINLEVYIRPVQSKTPGGC